MEVNVPSDSKRGDESGEAPVKAVPAQTQTRLDSQVSGKLDESPTRNWAWLCFRAEAICLFSC